jgi:hypothetical protein
VVVAREWLRRVRRRTRLLVLFSVALAIASIASADVAKQREERPVRYSLSCLPNTLPRSVADINRMITNWRSVPGFVGADVGADAKLQDGREIWVFGDTLRQADFEGQRFVRNSMLIFSRQCATVVIPRDHGAVVPDRIDGVGYWPMDVGVEHRAGADLVGVSLQRVRSTGAGAFDFRILGPALALFKVPVGKAPVLLVVRDLGADAVDPTRPVWGAAVETVGNLVYIYGTASPGDQSTFGRMLQVARVQITQAGDQSQWRYWDGHRWQPNARKAAALIPAKGGVSEVLSVFHRGHTWYAVSKRSDVLGKDLVIWKAPAPTGPFVPSAPLADLPSDKGVLRYMPLAHPDLLPAADSVVVSYSRNVADLNRLLEDPHLYRPYFLRVPLP